MHAKIYKRGLSNDFEQFFLVKNNFLTSVHNDVDDADNADTTDDADNTDNAGNYNRVIGIQERFLLESDAHPH